MPLDADTDDQDQSEAFDETLTEGDDTFGEPTNPDVAKDVLDSTYALGDGDTDDESAALDADELTDEQLDGMEGDADEDDLDDDNSEVGVGAADDVTDFAADTDFDDEDIADGVAAHPPNEADVVAMGDINDLAALGDGQGLSELEPDDVSDEDLAELGYTEKE